VFECSESSSRRLSQKKKKMIRRDPTRIEFTMEDVEKYKMRVQNASNVSSKATPAGKNGLAGGINSANQVDPAKSVSGGDQGRTKAEDVRQRIGYDPTPRPS